MVTTEQQISHEMIDVFQKRPLYFIEKYLKIKTWSGMRMVIDSVWKNKRTSVRACHGVSKTFTAAVIAVTFLNLFKPSIVITTAPVNRQVKDLLWKEIGAIYNSNKSEIQLQGNLIQTRINIDTDWYMVGFSTDLATNIEGYHSPNILWILDEAKGLPQWLYDSMEGSMTGGNSKVLEISTTDGADQQCAFRKHHESERDEWNCIHLSAFDSPFVNVDDYKDYKKYKNKNLFKYGKLKHGREWPEELEEKIQIANKQWIEERKKWIISRGDLWETKVEGNFATASENNVIPLKWVESAIDAEYEYKEFDQDQYGLDVARMGNDTNVLTRRIGGKVLLIREWGKVNTMETTGRVIQDRQEDDSTGVIKVDLIGVGAGVFDRLAELGYPVIGINSGEKAFDEKTYYNLRAEMWFTLRSLFELQHEHGNILSIPNDAELIEDLTGMRYLTKSDGRIIIEDKEKFKKRMGRSPNKGDSLVYCFAEVHFNEDV